jgi:hypothetical protein
MTQSPNTPRPYTVHVHEANGVAELLLPGYSPRAPRQYSIEADVAQGCRGANPRLRSDDAQPLARSSDPGRELRPGSDSVCGDRCPRRCVPLRLQPIEGPPEGQEGRRARRQVPVPGASVRRIAAPCRARAGRAGARLGRLDEQPPGGHQAADGELRPGCGRRRHAEGTSGRARLVERQVGTRGRRCRRVQRSCRGVPTTGSPVPPAASASCHSPPQRACAGYTDHGRIEEHQEAERAASRIAPRRHCICIDDTSYIQNPGEHRGGGRKSSESDEFLPPLHAVVRLRTLGL